MNERHLPVCPACPCRYFKNAQNVVRAGTGAAVAASSVSRLGTARAASVTPYRLADPIQLSQCATETIELGIRSERAA